MPAKLDIDENEIVRLRKDERLKLREIASRLGISKALVSKVLVDRGITGFVNYPELDNPDTFSRPDVIVARDLRISVNRVAAARRRLGIKKQRYIDIGDRRDTFALEMFGKCPGPNFDNISIFIRNELNKRDADVVIAFYIEMRADGDLWSRVTRSRAKKALSRRITPDVINGFVEIGVLEKE